MVRETASETVPVFRRVLRPTRSDVGMATSESFKLVSFPCSTVFASVGESWKRLDLCQLRFDEDFGKRNMPGKRARRRFSQLSEFERGLIIGMENADWSTRRVAGQVDRLECAVRNCWEKWTREVNRSAIRVDVDVAIVPQTISRHLAESNLKCKCPFRALPLTPEHRQLRLQWCQARSMWNVTDWKKVVFSD
ncbi:transposable element Tc1 transposase [Trichonephila clavipes]|nr:transposable element Tc1 transposase [Trichonephila clavipes]